MKKFEYIARLFFLVAALCFVLSVGTVSAASNQPAAETTHAAPAAHDTGGDGAHTGSAGDSHAADDAHGGAHDLVARSWVESRIVELALGHSENDMS